MPSSVPVQGVEDYMAETGGQVEFLNDLCKREVSEKGLSKVRGTKSSCTVSALWFLRALLFVSRFMQLMAESDSAAPSDCARRTYEEVRSSGCTGSAAAAGTARPLTPPPVHPRPRPPGQVLKQYHGFLLGGVVSAAMALAPTRDNFFKNVGTTAEASRGEMAAFVKEATAVNGKVKAFYDAQGWYWPDKS